MAAAEVNPSEKSREFVRKALRSYGEFFSHVAQRAETEAQFALNQVTGVDNTAARELSPEEFAYYRKRRNYLMGLFYEQLSREVQGQVQTSLIKEAKSLIDKLEIISD